jgi:effector-binding domain-containing protein
MARKIIMAMGVLVALAAAGQGFQDETVPSLKDIEPFAYCVVEHTGPLSEVSAVVGQLIGEMQDQNLFSAIQGPMVGVYPLESMSMDPGDLSWELGFIVTAQTEPQAPLIKKVWEYPTVAAVIHIGPYEKVGATIDKLMAWMKAEGCTAEGPLLERYLNNPMQVKPEDLRTEIWIPCRKD